MVRYFEHNGSAFAVVNDDYEPPPSVSPIAPPPGEGYAWVDGAWAVVQEEAVPYQLYKSVFIGRLTADEAVTMEQVLASADAKLRLLFNSVEYFVSSDPLFATLREAVAQALGGERADELLAAA